MVEFFRRLWAEFRKSDWYRKHTNVVQRVFVRKTVDTALDLGDDFLNEVEERGGEAMPLVEEEEEKRKRKPRVDHSRPRGKGR